MKNAKLRINDCINDCIYLTYDFRMTIIIREYEMYLTWNKTHGLST